MQISTSTNTPPVQSPNQDVSVAVLKKTLDIEKANAAQLLEALPDPESPIGQNINIKV